MAEAFRVLRPGGRFIMFPLHRFLYYSRSIPTLLVGVGPTRTLLAAFLGLPLARPFEVRLRRGGLRFRVRGAMDVWIVKETCLDRDYERIGAPVQDGWTLLDIGAALGDWAVDVATRCPRCTVHAYEPSPDSLALLRENLRLNGIEHVTVWGEALTGQAALVTLDVSGAAVQHRVGGGTLTVPAIPLREALARLPGGACDLLKMDCEGSEYDILFNADEASLARVRRLVMEVHDGVTPFTRDDLAAFLRERGFRVSLHPGAWRRELGLLYATR